MDEGEKKQDDEGAYISARHQIRGPTGAAEVLHRKRGEMHGDVRGRIRQGEGESIT